MDRAAAAGRDDDPQRSKSTTQHRHATSRPRYGQRRDDGGSRKRPRARSEQGDVATRRRQRRQRRQRQRLGHRCLHLEPEETHGYRQRLGADQLLVHHLVELDVERPKTIRTDRLRRQNPEQIHGYGGVDTIYSTAPIEWAAGVGVGQMKILDGTMPSRQSTLVTPSICPAAIPPTHRCTWIRILPISSICSSWMATQNSSSTRTGRSPTCNWLVIQSPSS